MIINQKHLSEWVESQEREFLNDIIDLIHIPSVSVETGDPEAPFGIPCREVLKKIIEIISRMGFEGKNHEGYCATLLWPGETEEEIGIFSHLDVVPEGTGWNYEPFEAMVEEGYVVGRGSSDNKGPAVAALYALKYLKDSGITPKHSIRMFFGVNEECGMKDIVYYTEHNPMPFFSFIPDASFPVCHGEKGVLELESSFDFCGTELIEFVSGVASNAVPSDAYAVLKGDCHTVKQRLKEKLNADSFAECKLSCYGTDCKLEVNGIAGHAAFPEGAVSAEVKLAEILRKSELLSGKAQEFVEAVCLMFADYYGAGLGVPYEDSVSGKLTHVGGMVRMKEGKAIQNINIRYPVTADRDLMVETVKKRLTDLGFMVEMISDNPPCYVNKDRPEIKILTEICNKYLELDLEPYVMGGGTYARKLKNAVAYGPGIPFAASRFGSGRGNGHQPDECMSIDILKKAVCIYAEAVAVLDGLV